MREYSEDTSNLIYYDKEEDFDDGVTFGEKIKLYI